MVSACILIFMVEPRGRSLNGSEFLDFLVSPIDKLAYNQLE